MEPTRRRELIAVLRVTRELLALPENDYLWSSWPDAAAALREVDGVIDSLERLEPVNTDLISVLFVVTGPICEVAVSSGWGENYVRLGKRVDELLGQ